MAIATNAAHVSRALDFFNKEGKYFSIGGTQPWEDETKPRDPQLTDFILDDIIALKKVDNTHLVIEDKEYGTIQYRDTKWRIITPLETTTASPISANSSSVVLKSLTNVKEGIKLRIADIYEGKVTGIDENFNEVVLDTPAPISIPENSLVESNAYVEGAKHVYLDCSLNYDNFPTEYSYRQVGIQTSVKPSDVDILRSAKITGSSDEYTSLGRLEILDNRPPTVREADQKETLAIIVEF